MPFHLSDQLAVTMMGRGTSHTFFFFYLGKEGLLSDNAPKRMWMGRYLETYLTISLYFNSVGKL